MNINDYLLQKGKISFKGSEKAYRAGTNFVYHLMNTKQEMHITLINGNAKNDDIQEYLFNNATGNDVVEKLGYETNENKFEYIMNFLNEFHLIDYINIRINYKFVRCENFSYKNKSSYSILIMTNNN